MSVGGILWGKQTVSEHDISISAHCEALDK